MPKISLENIETGLTIPWDGEEDLIIGRGAVSGCHDKRVSRKHATLTIKPDGEMSMYAIHVNPCFFMEGGAPPIVMIKKGDSVLLNLGDCIGLLNSGAWFKLVVKNPPPNNDNRNTITPEPVTPPLLRNSVQSPVISTSEVPIPSTSSVISPKTRRPSWKTIDEPVSPKRSALDNSPVSPNNVDMPESHDDLMVSPSLVAAEVGETPSVPSTPANLSINEPDQNVMMNTSDVAQMPAISSDVSLAGAGAVTNETTEPVNNQVNAVPASSATDRPAVKQEPATSPTSSSSTVVNPAVLKVKDEPPHSPTPTLPAVAFVTPVINAPQPQPQPMAQRPLCQYQQACYRTNSTHKANFSHPWDPDWLPVDRRTLCQYDPYCYRGSRAHRVNFRHTCDPGVRRQAPATSLNPPLLLQNLPSSDEEDDSSLFNDNDEDMDEDPYATDGDADDEDYVPPEE